MKIAVFYENIYDGVRQGQLSMEETLRSFQKEGMSLLYISYDSWKRDEAWLPGLLQKIGMGIEGMHAFCDFARLKDAAPYREIVDTAVSAGAGNLLFVPGFLSGGNSIDDIEAIKSGMIRAAAYGKEKGIPILMEDFDGLTSPYNCMAGLKYFMDTVPCLGCAFDTGNFEIFHEDNLVAFDLFADKIQTVHLKDRAKAPRHEKDTPLLCADHQAVYAVATGTGDMRIDEILRRLKARNYPGNVIVELYCCDSRYVLKDIRLSLQWLRSQGIGE